MTFVPMTKVQRLGNSVEVEVDFFFDNLRSFKTKLLSSLLLLYLSSYVISYTNVFHPYVQFSHI